MTARHENAAFGAEINQDCEAHYTETENRVFESVCLLGLGVTKVDLSNCKLYTTPSFFTDLCFCGLYAVIWRFYAVGRFACTCTMSRVYFGLPSCGVDRFPRVQSIGLVVDLESNYRETFQNRKPLLMINWDEQTKSKWFKHWLDLPRMSNCLQSYTHCLSIRTLQIAVAELLQKTVLQDCNFFPAWFGLIDKVTSPEALT